MYLPLKKTAILFAVIFAAAIGALAQTDASGEPMDREGRRVAPPKNFREMMARQRLEREKKEHEEMIVRGERALEIASQLETSLDQSAQVTSKDREKLESLEELVEKIRKDLGGRDEGSAEADEAAKPSTFQEALKYLKTTTGKLVDELKKTSRFSISAAAIHASNNVIKLTRFLRLRN